MRVSQIASETVRVLVELLVCARVLLTTTHATTPVYLSFHPMAKEHVHALKGLAWVWLQLARLPPPASRMRRSRRLRDTLAAAPGLLAHASVTEAVSFCPMGPKLRLTLRYSVLCVQSCADSG